MDFHFQAEITEVGTNVIGILPGKYWQTIEDRPILVGAHWDSVSNTTGFDDNGSGVAVMLEVARVLANSKVSPGGKSCLVPDHTILFVAFDSEEPGSFGSIQVSAKNSSLQIQNPTPETHILSQSVAQPLSSLNRMKYEAFLSRDSQSNLEEAMHPSILLIK